MNQPLAYVHPGAKIAKNVVIEPFATIHNNLQQISRRYDSLQDFALSYNTLR